MIQSKKYIQVCKMPKGTERNKLFDKVSEEFGSKRNRL